MSVSWLIGRGCSIAAGLTWVVPPYWRLLPRWLQIRLIIQALTAAQQSPAVTLDTHRNFLRILDHRTVPGAVHALITTNWDGLLEMALESIWPGVHPGIWLDNMYVAHINGRIERIPRSAAGSPFLLEEDRGTVRTPTVEANNALGRILWSDVVVVVGMSFECEQDKFLLKAIKQHEDNLPAGEATWIVVNSNLADLGKATRLLRHHLLRANVVSVELTFQDWVRAGLPELVTTGSLLP